MPRTKIIATPTRGTPAPPSAKWVRSETGVDRNGTPLTAGDRVKVLNGKNMPDWVFRAHVKNETSEWLEVFGRNNSEVHQLRSFDVDKVERIPDKKRRGRQTPA